MSRAIAGPVLAAWLCSVVHAQTAADAKPAEAKLEFEVASIKPSAQPGRGVIRLDPKGGPGSGDPGRVTYTFTTIQGEYHAGRFDHRTAGEEQADEYVRRMKDGKVLVRYKPGNPDVSLAAPI